MHIQARVAECCLVVSLLMGAAPVSNLTGNWRLILDQSKWGKMKKPQSEDVRIEHNEPELKYSGTVTDTGETTHVFEFSGAIDGNEYPVKDTYGDGMLAIKRVNPRTISSVSKSSDGKHEIQARTYI